MASGWGYKDNTVVDGAVYYYQIVAYDGSGNLIHTVANDLKVTAGTFEVSAAPVNVEDDAGDARKGNHHPR